MSSSIPSGPVRITVAEFDQGRPSGLISSTMIVPSNEEAERQTIVERSIDIIDMGDLWLATPERLQCAPPAAKSRPGAP